jgi:uncharacterized protein YkwD
MSVPFCRMVRYNGSRCEMIMPGLEDTVRQHNDEQSMNDKQPDKTPRRILELSVAAGILIVVLVAQFVIIHNQGVRHTTLAAGPTATHGATPGRTATAKPKPGHVVTPVPTSLKSDFITRAIARTNMYRRQYAPTCPQLAYNANLTLAAYRHSEDMALHGFLSHSGSDGSTIPQRFKAAGYHFSTWAENITWYATTPEQAVDDWFNETPPNDGHRRNILGCTLKEIGIGFYYNPHDAPGAHNYWTEDFGSPCNPYCL